MVTDTIIEIDADGILSFVWNDSLADLAAMGAAVIDRASYVEPDGSLWSVDLSPVNGPFVSGFALRSEAIDFELSWIRENLGL